MALTNIPIPPLKCLVLCLNMIGWYPGMINKDFSTIWPISWTQIISKKKFFSLKNNIKSKRPWKFALIEFILILSKERSFEFWKDWIKLSGL